ncbi:MAG: tetratricopeptide repeat protein [Deltaproteobacteria bacterium]|jgi:tetratricopeptide (TPR) repeat protein|nr:tetratricopeptide repeat protein [Deltaproteobacteria bacterium]MBW2448813.1 tetratricopeptide repeat protein [Deltaproteobacteria bacterium]MBW2492730.1 tetratricopeptide repeat protein [Deltaproteobacteria bacterium]
MKKIYIGILILLITVVWSKHIQNVYAFDGNALEYFDLGLKTSMAYKKTNYFTKAIELNPRLAPAYEKRGLNYYFQGKYNEVIEDFTNYIQLVPNKADAYRMLGMAYLKINNPEKAVVNFDRALDLEPEMKGVLGYRGESFRMIGQLDEAIDDSNRALAMESDLRILSDVYRTRAKAYMELGQEVLANADFKRAAEIDPRYFFYRYISGYADLEDMRRAGLIGMIGMAFVFIFGLKLRPPKKDD